MKVLGVLVLMVISYCSQAQVWISGKVTGSKGQPLPGVSITIRGTYDGATSDSTGFYSIETAEKGKQMLDVSAIGYREMEAEVIIKEQSIKQDLVLRELITDLKAVVISAGSFEAGDKKKSTVLTALDIVTTASALGDVTGAIKTLPGAQQVGESEGLFVRGGSAAESRIYIDGSLVNNFFYSSLPGLATRGRFNPFLFKGTVFSSGGYSSLYGQALSSVLLLESRDLPEKTQAELSFSVIGGGGGIQKLAANKKSSWGATYNYTNLWLAFKVSPQKQDFYKIPVYHQGDINYRHRTGRGFLKYYGYFNWNELGFSAEDIDSAGLKNAFDLENLNTYHNLSYSHNVGAGWKIYPSLSFSNNKDLISNELRNQNNEKANVSGFAVHENKNYRLSNRAFYTQGRIVTEKKFAGLNALRFGGEYFYNNEKSAFTRFDGSVFNEVISDNLTAFFAETDFYLSNNLAIKVGSRAEYSTTIKKWNLVPRTSLAYKLNAKSQASFAYGIFYQNPERRILPSTFNLDYSKASHYILQYQRNGDRNLLRAEVYYKDYSNLFKTAPDLTGRSTAVNNNGFGYAKGLEIFWRDRSSFKTLDYWVSYSYLDTKRDYLNFPSSIQPSFAAAHTLSVVLKKFSLPWKTGFNVSYNFSTGRPYYHFRYNSTEGKYQIADIGKTINYNNLSFSLNYLPNLGKGGSKPFVVWVLSISNVLNQKQVFGYNYSAISDRKVPVMPGSRSFVYLGCFMSFGIDRTQDAINNNL